MQTISFGLISRLTSSTAKGRSAPGGKAMVRSRIASRTINPSAAG